MNGDFTRDTYRGRNHYTRVLMQQGRVQLDADWNEQAAIGHERLRMLAADLIGPHGGPVSNCGFQLVSNPDLLENLKDDLGRPLRPERIKELTARMQDGDLLIGQGRYYVDGLQAQCDTWQTYGEQLGYPFDDGTTVDELQGARGALVYLDVWERHVSGAERADLLEVALAGSTRPPGRAGLAGARPAGRRAAGLRRLQVAPTAELAAAAGAGPAAEGVDGCVRDRSRVPLPRGREPAVPGGDPPQRHRRRRGDVRVVTGERLGAVPGAAALRRRHHGRRRA
ncbi:hypothetical protein G7085_06865 [Tessaracoccus sp. HDW20]|nr:hypothetical protein [Tessaracoccus coleopterorum]